MPLPFTFTLVYCLQAWLEAYRQSEGPEGPPSLSANIRREWTSMAVANNQVYYEMATITTAKSFIV
jgi:hypothetical protein